ncbi:MAG TPA: helix-turn-helix domain-containing protein [Thermomicrobiaceae bacterium]|nr:helix-turn-helix domain-containing protein [Thermomicrobiaceae bacterium]
MGGVGRACRLVPAVKLRYGLRILHRHNRHTEDTSGAQDEVSFGGLLKLYRSRSGLTQEELAERAGLSARGISDLERGLRQAPHRDTVQMLADALTLTPDDRARLARAVDRRRRTATGQAGPFAPAQAALPISLSSFAGREHERVRLRELLTRPTVRMVTLTGPGGAGKTRLALEVAYDLQELGTQEISFVSLATVRDPAQLATTLLQALGGREDPGQAAEEALRHILRAEPRLLLDNFEQIVEAAPLLTNLLGTCPEFTVLVTSRVLLRLAGEHVFPLEPLRQKEAVELFTARAHAIQPDIEQEVGMGQRSRPSARVWITCCSHSSWRRPTSPSCRCRRCCSGCSSGCHS